MDSEHEQAVRERAYALWEKEGRPENRSIDNWLQAEAELAKPLLAGVLDTGKPVRSVQSSGSRRKAG